VPKYISECWKKANPGDEVGKVVISKQKYVLLRSMLIIWCDFFGSFYIEYAYYCFLWCLTILTTQYCAVCGTVCGMCWHKISRDVFTSIM